ncbi:calcium-binding protein [Roseibium aggregatum]|uniref:Cyclolysin n=1 Tax=Roseibium aggregatum TaxID=187304 RepID=A0A0M6XXU9_9HYPH|nr:calcium-binding protein [Roseibium aggregatum]CTQ42247.1 Cyclolysin [Roseibium aggregatum]
MAIVFRGHKNDFIQTANRNDIIFAGGGNDTINSEGGDDLIYAGRGDDIINAGSGDDLVFGGAGNDLITGGTGADVVFAGRGNDTAVFVAADNTDNEGRGDYYDGGSGCDTLRIELTSDMWSQDAVKLDMLAFLEHLSTFGSGEEFRFSSVNLCVKRFEKLEVFVDGQKVDLFVTDPDDGLLVIDRSSSTEDETITTIGDGDTDIKTGSGSDTITAGNGNNVIDAGDGNNKVTTGTGADIITTGSGDDVIDSGDGNDTIYIGDGDDVVRAGGGNDTIIAGAGGGIDLIDTGSGSDTVNYPSDRDGISVDLNQFDRSSTALGNGMTVGDLLAQNGYAADTPVAIAQGISIDTDVLIGVEHVAGGDGNDILIGNDKINRLIGAGGDDTILGNDGEDELFGGAGNDTLNGGAADDLLFGGSGDDVVSGNSGFDTLKLSGNINEYNFTALDNGQFQVEDLVAGRDGSDLFDTIEQVTFANTTVGLFALVGTIDRYGTPGNDTIHGTAARERFHGGNGDDKLYGYEAEDTFQGGAGDDTFDGGLLTNDDENFEWDIVDYYEDYRDGGVQGVYVNLDQGWATDPFGDTDTLIDIERVFGTEVDDVIIGSSEWAEAYDPFLGNDIIHGNGGWDDLRYNLASGWGAPGAIVVTFSATEAGSGSVIDPGGYTDVFTDIQKITATAYNDTLTGGLGEQTFAGLEGSDTIDGGEGFDLATYHQDASYGGYAGISVDLEITDGNGFAVLTDGFGDADKVRNIESIRGTGSNDEIRGDSANNDFRGEAGDDLLEGRGGSDILEGGFGNDVLLGGADDDALHGDSGNDILDGGSGDDFMLGGLDADRFQFSAGSGNDTIGDFELSVDGLVLQGGLTIVSLSEASVGGDASLDTIVEFSSGDQVVLLDVSGVVDPSQLQVV